METIKPHGDISQCQIVYNKKACILIKYGETKNGVMSWDEENKLMDEECKLFIFLFSAN